jgi:endoglucanase
MASHIRVLIFAKILLLSSFQSGLGQVVEGINMKNTVVAASFVDPTTIQLRFELGNVIDARQTTTLPAGATADSDWFWQDGKYLGRVQLDGKTFMPVDSYDPSAIDDLFDLASWGKGRRAAVDDPARWDIQINGQSATIETLSRKANILETAEVQWGKFAFSTVQNVFIKLDAPLQTGDKLTLGFDDPDFAQISAVFEPKNVVSEAIHVNLAGYDPDDVHKIAYLSSWNGFTPRPDAADAGTAAPQTYDGPLGFQVIDDQTGRSVLSGMTKLGTPAGETTNFSLNFAATDVWEMDLSGLKTTGSYHIVVDGVGRSPTFDVSDMHWTDIFKTSFTGFYHQRSGIALTSEFTDWVHPRSLHPDDGKVTVYASTTKLMDVDEGYDNSKPDQFGPLVAGATTEVLPDAWGGWHDAGDWDRRTQHMEASRVLMELVELAPDWAEKTDGRIPESGDAVPDLLDEAAWGLSVFARLQTADGGVRGGIEGDNYRGYGAASWTEEHTLYAYAPDVWSSWEFAASAAKLARVLKPYDSNGAADWQDRAERAMTWAEARVPGAADMDATLLTSRNLAALELYATTGKTDYHDVFLATTPHKTADPNLDWDAHQYAASFLYNRLDPSLVDQTVAANARADLLEHADFLLDQGTRGGFGFIHDPYATYGWGNNAQQPLNSLRFMVAAHVLTGDEKYLAATQADVQYVLGANPMNMAFLTGLDGVRSPQEVLNTDADASGTAPPSGITLYGDYNIYDFGKGWFHDVMWNDVFPNPYQAPVHESFQGYWGFVPSAEYTVQQGITSLTYVTGYLAGLQDDATSPGTGGGGTGSPGTGGGGTGGGSQWGQLLTAPEPSGALVTKSDAQGRQVGTGNAERFEGTTGDDVFITRGGDDHVRGKAGADVLFGRTGNDILLGDDGNDILIGGAGDDWHDGGAGDDLMSGRAGADVFVFSGGADIVTDYQPGVDTIAISRSLVATGIDPLDLLRDFSALESNKRVLMIAFSDDDTLMLRSKTPLSLEGVAQDLAIA